MIVDRILDRKDGVQYIARDFYHDMMEYGGCGIDIARAMDCGNEDDVKKELCRYIDVGEYNPKIKDYINSVNWLRDDKLKSESIIGMVYRFGKNDYQISIMDFDDTDQAILQAIFMKYENEMSGERGDKTLSIENANIDYWEL